MAHPHELMECMAGMCQALKLEDQAEERKKQVLWDRRLTFTAKKLSMDDNNVMDQDNTSQLNEAILEEKINELLQKIKTLGLSDSFTDNMVKMILEFIGWSETHEEDIERLMLCGLLIKSVSSLTHLKNLRSSHHNNDFPATMMDPN